MSLTLGRRTTTRSFMSAPSRLWQALRGRYARMAKARRLRRELATMDPRMLADIGVSRAQLRFELEEWERDPR